MSYARSITKRIAKRIARRIARRIASSYARTERTYGLTYVSIRTVDILQLRTAREGTNIFGFGLCPQHLTETT